MRSNVQMVLSICIFLCETSTWHFELLAPPGTRDVAARDSGDKRVQGTEPDIVNGSIFAIKLRR